MLPTIIASRHHTIMKTTIFLRGKEKKNKQKSSIYFLLLQLFYGEFVRSPVPYGPVGSRRPSPWPSALPPEDQRKPSTAPRRADPLHIDLNKSTPRLETIERETQTRPQRRHLSCSRALPPSPSAEEEANNQPMAIPIFLFLPSPTRGPIAGAAAAAVFLLLLPLKQRRYHIRQNKPPLLSNKKKTHF